MPDYNKLPPESSHFNGKIYQKFVDDMRLCSLSLRTVYGYVRSVRKLCQHAKKAPTKLTQSDVRAFLLNEIVHKESASGTQSVLLSGIKFFFRITCPRDWDVLNQTKIRRVKSLPEVITQSQVFKIIDASKTLRLKVFLWTTYTLGLRISDAVNLQLGDIDSQRMMVHIHLGKGDKDRYVPLPVSTLKGLRAFWKTHKHPKFLFPAKAAKSQKQADVTTPVSIGTIQGAIKRITEKLNFGKKVSCHTMRHCYGTHLLEAGVSLKAIQKFMGHSSLQTTMVYLHLTETAEADSRQVINQLFKGRQKP